MAGSKLTAAVLIVSTTASKDPSTDASGAALKSVLEQEGGDKWEVIDTKIVGDVVTQIQKQILVWADAHESPNLIITTGGTGFAVTDTTPEAVQPLLHKTASGLVHGMMSASLSVTPFAMMSRPVAGVRHKSVIITLPGSPKGAKENLQAVLKTLPHACLQAAGVDSRALHSGGVKKLEADAGLTGGHSHSHHSHSHDHSHHRAHGHNHGDHGHGKLIRHTNPDSNPLSNDPSLGATRRYRKSPYPMLSVAEALGLIKDHTPKPEIVAAKVDPTLVGAVLAVDVHAKENVPAFRASIVDGYAVVVPEGGHMKGIFPVVSVSNAAPGSEDEVLKKGEIARITTGAPLPKGATSVIMVEDTVLKTMTDDGKEEKEVEILAEGVKEGENIREVGSDVKAGSLILSAGSRISAVGGEIGLLTSVGVKEVQIYRRPIVGVLSTGDELVEMGTEEMRYGQVRDTNRPTLLTAARAAGYEALDLGIAKDQAAGLEETLRESLRKIDILVTTGGVSMGELDLLKPTIERALGGTIHFGRVAMKPGKPTTFATVPVKNISADTGAGERVEKVVFSLPGNPASALVTFHLFVLPSLHHFSGVEPAGCTKVPVTLSHDFGVDKQRMEYHRAVVTVGPDGGLVATSTGGQRSSRVGSMATANALLEMEKGEESVMKGTKAMALLMCGL